MKVEIIFFLYIFKHLIAMILKILKNNDILALDFKVLFPTN